MAKESSDRQAKACILTINGGSSSIKFALFEAGHTLQRILAGTIERIGLPEATFVVKGLNQADNFTRTVPAANHTAAVGVLMDWIEDRIRRGELTAVGHRVVHGGPKYSEPAADHTGNGQGVAPASAFRSRTSAGRDPADRGIPSPVSRSGAGGLFRYGLSPRPAARGTDVADPAPLRGAGRAPLRLSRVVVCVSDGGAGACGWSASGARSGSFSLTSATVPAWRRSTRANLWIPAWVSRRLAACR